MRATEGTNRAAPLRWLAGVKGGDGGARRGWRGRVVLAAALSALLVIGGAGYWLLGGAVRTPAAPSPPVAAAAAGAQSPPASGPTIREQVRALIEREVRPLHGRAPVESYLAQLEQRARARGRVSALEVEPGLEALRQNTDEIGPADSIRLSTVFSERMVNLGRELGSTKGENP